MSDTLICIPTYNEALNIGALSELILNTESEVDILVVDDNSPDGTAKVIERLIAEGKTPQIAQRLHLLKRTQNKGFANSYKDGFKWAYAKGYKYLIQMDADFSHHPRYLSSMLALKGQFDLVSGSRYGKGGKIVNWPLKRRLLSAGGNLYVRFWLGCPLRDMTTGYNLWSLDALKKINLESLKSDGYSFLIELKFFATKAGLRSTEVPIIFEDRKAQESKMSTKIFKEAVIKVPLLRITNFLNKNQNVFNSLSQENASLKIVPFEKPKFGNSQLEEVIHKKTIGLD